MSMSRSTFIKSAAALPVCSMSLLSVLGGDDTARADEAAGEDSRQYLLDLGGYSDEDVLAILWQVQEEVVARGLSGVVADVPKGRYTVGVDLPAGSYIYTSDGESTLEGSDDVALAFEFGILSVTDSEGNELINEYIGNYGEESRFLSVKDGDVIDIPRRGVLEISGGGLVFRTK